MFAHASSSKGVTRSELAKKYHTKIITTTPKGRMKDAVVAVSHALEDILDRLRKETMSSGPALMALLLKKPTPGRGPIAAFFKLFNRFFDWLSSSYGNIVGCLARKVARLEPLEAYFIVKELGVSDAMPLLRFASAEQLQAIVDLDCWVEERPDPAELDAWLAKKPADLGRYNSYAWLCYKNNFDRARGIEVARAGPLFFVGLDRRRAARITASSVTPATYQWLKDGAATKGLRDGLKPFTVEPFYFGNPFLYFEIAGEVDVRFGLLKGKQATWPVTALADRWLPHATAFDTDRFTLAHAAVAPLAAATAAAPRCSA